MVHLVDIVTDILYIATVPVYHKSFQIVLIVSMILPALAIVCVQRRSFGWNKMQTLMAVFGALPLYELKTREQINPKEMVTVTLR